MHMSPTVLACIGVLLVGSNVAALPQYPGTIPNPQQQCQDYSGGDIEVRDVVQSEYDGETELASGAICRGECTVGATDTWSKSMTVSLGAFNGATQIANKAWQFLAGMAVNPGVSWTTGTATTTMRTVTCPSDDQLISCGITATPRMALVKGQSNLKNSDSALCNSVKTGWQDFELHAPVRVQTWKGPTNIEKKGDEAVVSWAACIWKCETPELCKLAREKNHQLCPGTQEPEHWNSIFSEAMLDAVKTVFEGSGEGDQQQ